MTHRTELNVPTRIEVATRQILQDLTEAVHQRYAVCGVGAAHRMQEDEFRRIIAFFFFNKSLTDWCHDLSIVDATDPTERSARQ
jgi:hypothetical protein